jgi:hypothetical protein
VSIFEETGGAQAGVSGDRSLELFLDRFEEIARFDQASAGLGAGSRVG